MSNVIKTGRKKKFFAADELRARIIFHVPVIFRLLCAAHENSLASLQRHKKNVIQYYDSGVIKCDSNSW